MITVDAGEWEGLDGMGEDELRALKPKAEPLMWQAGIDFQRALKNILTGERTGRTYKISKTGKLHVASAPGEPPAQLFGILRNSMGFSRPKWEGWMLQMEVGSGLGIGQDKRDEDALKAENYALRLEFGGIDSRGVKILPRPYMAPTAERMDPHIQKLFEDGL